MHSHGCLVLCAYTIQLLDTLGPLQLRLQEHLAPGHATCLTGHWCQYLGAELLGQSRGLFQNGALLCARHCSELEGEWGQL